MAATSAQRNLQAAHRAEMAQLVEEAQSVRELQDVLQRISAVHRQLQFAASVQSEAREDIERKSAARAAWGKKLEKAIYTVVLQAQIDGGLDAVIFDLLS